MKRLLLVAAFSLAAFGQEVSIGKPAGDTKALVTAEVYHWGNGSDYIALRVIPANTDTESLNVSVVYEDNAGTVHSKATVIDVSATWPENYCAWNVKNVKRIVSATVREIRPSQTFLF